MFSYKIILRRSMLQEIEVIVNENGRIKASKTAIAQVNADPKTMWRDTGTIDEQPYSVSEEKVKMPKKKKKVKRVLEITSCGQCGHCNFETLKCYHPKLVESIPDGSPDEWKRVIKHDNVITEVLEICPLGKK